MPPNKPPTILLLLLLLTLSLLPLLTFSKRPYVLFLTQDDLHTTTTTPDSSDPDSPDSSEFPDPDSPDSSDLDPGSWRHILDPDPDLDLDLEHEQSLYYSGLSKLIDASSTGDVAVLETAVDEIEVAASNGDANARSVLGFLYQMGIGRKRDRVKAFLYHSFAAKAAHLGSKMALAHIYARQDVSKSEMVI